MNEPEIDLNNIAEFTNNLSAMAQKAPSISSKRELYRIVNGLRKKYGFSMEQKKEEILELIKSGIASKVDLEENSTFDRKDVSAILSELITEKKIRAETFSVTGIGRRSLCYLPAKE